MKISKFERILRCACIDIIDEEENEILVDIKDITSHNFSMSFEENIKEIINLIDDNKLKDYSKFNKNKYIFFLLD